MHVPRPRLIQLLTEAPVALIEAGGGYGKSVLAGELRRSLGIASAEAVLERDVVLADELIGALRRGLRRAGLSDAAAALSVAGVGDERPLLLVVDEVQRASGEAVEQLVALATGLPEQHRLLLVGRRLDPRLTRLSAVRLGPEDLAFDDDELAALLGGVDHVAQLRRVSQGWPAAAEVAALWLARDGVVPRGTLAQLLDGLLAGADRARLARLAQLPLLSVDVAEAVAGPGALTLLLDAGLPLRAGRPGWLELPDPVREALAGSPLDVEAARSAAAVYADAGELSAALALLSGDGVGVASLLASLRWQDLAVLDLAELRVILSTLPPDALAAHPFALVQVSRLAERTVDFELRVSLLRQALALLEDGRVRREVEAELVATLAVTEPSEATEASAQAVLDGALPDETRARARALTALARVDSWRGEPAAMLRAEGYLAQAAALCRLAREPEWEAWTLNALGYRVAFARGDLELAVSHMQGALALLPEPDGERAGVATFLAEALAYLGRLDEAESALREAAEIGRRLGDHRVRAYAAWTWTTLASLRGDAAATIQRIRAVERHPGDWFEHPTGAEFFADAALALARVGEACLAAAYAERARERASVLGHPEIAWIATGAVEARFGDPLAALDVLGRFAASPQQAPRDEWRTLLFQAFAASRCGDGRVASFSAQAYAAAEALGHPDLPARHEPDIAAALGASPGPAAFEVTLLGGFAVSASGRAVAPPPGRGATLVKLLALSRGPVSGEEAVEVLWPGSDGPTGRRRLRNLLNRVRAACGDLVARDGEALVLDASAEVDARAFEGLAAGVRSAAAGEQAGLARAALARYAGDLLPGDRYEAWASAPRERLRRRYLDLLDLLSDDAVERGDLDEAIRLLDQAQIAEPLDESRYVRAAELLLFQGRRGSAAVLVERALALRERLGLPETPTLNRLRDATGT